MSGAVVRLPPHKASLLALLRLECLRVRPLLVLQCLPLVALHHRDSQRTGGLIDPPNSPWLRFRPCLSSRRGGHKPLLTA